MRKRSALTEVLSKSARGENTTVAEQPVKSIGASPGAAQPGRVGKINITGYFDPAVKKSLRLIQASDPNKTVQDLLAEALNDLFAKHNVPQTALITERD